MAAPNPTPTQPVDITEEIQSGNTPGQPNKGISPTPGTVSTAKARLTESYVASGYNQYFLNYLRSLPHTLDDVTKDFGDDLYDRMQRDAQLAKLVIDFKAGMLQGGMQLSPAVDEKDPNGERARDLMTWCQWVLDRMKTALPDVLWDMAGAVAVGSRVAELVWELGADLHGAQKLLLKAIKVKPRTSTAFVTNSFNDLVGLLVLMPGQPFIPQTGLLITDPTALPNFLPREKFAIYTFRPQNDDPRGTSVLRPAYDAWWFKQQVKGQYLKYLAQFANPSLIGYTPEGAEAETTTTMDQYGGISVAVGKTPETAMNEMLANFQNCTALTFVGGSKVDLIESKGNGEAFTAAFSFLNNEMAGAILGQTLATEEGKHQSRAASNTHEATMDTIIRQAKDGLARMIAEDILTPLVRYNFGDAATAYLPKVSLGSIEQQNQPQQWVAFADVFKSGALGQSQMDACYAMLGFPARDWDADAVLEEKAQQMANELAAQNAALKPVAQAINTQDAPGEVAGIEAGASQSGKGSQALPTPIGQRSAPKRCAA